jgi:hypothetical protein
VFKVVFLYRLEKATNQGAERLNILGTCNRVFMDLRTVLLDRLKIIHMSSFEDKGVNE